MRIDRKLYGAATAVSALAVSATTVAASEPFTFTVQDVLLDDGTVIPAETIHECADTATARVFEYDTRTDNATEGSSQPDGLISYSEFGELFDSIKYERDYYFEKSYLYIRQIAGDTRSTVGLWNDRGVPVSQDIVQAAFVESIASRYGGRFILGNITREPDNPDFIAQYQEFCNLAAPAPGD